MWNQLENKFKVQFLCCKDDVLKWKPGEKITQLSKYLAAGKLWWLVLKRSEDTDFITVWLYASRGNPKVVVHETYRLVANCRSNNIEVEFDATEFAVYHVPRGSGCRDFVRVSTLKSDASKFCCNDIFVFEVDVTVLSIDDVPVRQPSVITFHEIVVDPSVSKRTRATAISKPARSNGEDIIVVSKCGIEFACHSYILATNEVFERVYLNTDDENEGPTPAKKSKGEPGRILLQMSAETLRVILYHIYHGSLKFDVSIAGDVLHAAEIHDLPLLKRECEVVMSNHLAVSTFLDDLMIAELTNSTTLKDACLSFWSEHGRDIMKTEDWDNFMDTKDTKNKILIRNLCEQLFDVIAEKSN